MLDSLGRLPAEAAYGAEPGMAVARVGDRVLVDIPEWYLDETGAWKVSFAKDEP